MPDAQGSDSNRRFCIPVFYFDLLFCGRTDVRDAQPRERLSRYRNKLVACVIIKLLSIHENTPDGALETTVGVQ